MPPLQIPPLWSQGRPRPLRKAKNDDRNSHLAQASDAVCCGGKGVEKNRSLVCHSARCITAVRCYEVGDSIRDAVASADDRNVLRNYLLFDGSCSRRACSIADHSVIGNPRPPSVRLKVEPFSKNSDSSILLNVD